MIFNFFKKDNIYYGLSLGLIAPMLGMVLFKYLNMRSSSFSYFVEFLQLPGMLPKALSLSLIANALVFTYYINTHRDRTSKGILISTGIYGLVILLLKTLF